MAAPGLCRLKLRDADAAKILRMASALRETAAAAARLSPDWAEDAAWTADFLARMTPSASAQRSRRRDLPTHGAELDAERRAVASAWYRHRVSIWPSDALPPTLEQDWADAQRDGLATADGHAVPQRYVRAARWQPWRRRVGRPKKSVENL